MARLPAVLVLVILIGPFAHVQAMAQESAAEPQFRAYWVDSFGPALYTEAQIDQLVADTRAANLNAIVAQVTRRADCLCNRSLMPRTEAEIDPEPFDPLQTLIDKAHAAGLEVHAWLNAGIMWALDAPPQDPSHVFHAHGPSAPEPEDWVMRRYDGAIRGGNLYFFDPGHPAAADYIASMALSIIRNYDVDGINFDFIRYPDFNPAENVPSWGYNPVALARFRALTGRTDIPAPTDPEWMAWRREQITSILRRVYIEAYAIKPLLRISADTITYGNISEDDSAWTQWRPYREVLQDWRAWMEEGILDLNIPMNYRREVLPPPGQLPQFEPWNRFIKDHQYNRQAAIGTALYLNSVDENVAQIRRALTPTPSGRNAAGWVGFSYRTPDVLVNQRRRSPEEGRAELTRALTESRAFDVTREYDFNLIRAPVFASPVPVPPMSWKLVPRTGHVHGVVVSRDGSGADQVRVDLYDAAGTLVTSRRTTGTGWFGFVDLLPGNYTLAVTGAAETAGSTSITVAAGRVTPVSLVLGR